MDIQSATEHGIPCGMSNISFQYIPKPARARVITALATILLNSTTVGLKVTAPSSSH
jgi:hypothetical protein